MSRLPPAPPDEFGGLKDWANEVYEYLTSQAISTEEVEAAPIFLSHVDGSEKLFTDGLMMFDPSVPAPVYSYGGQWRSLYGAVSPGINMVWRGPWDDDTTYHEGDVVIDGNWLAIANTDTDERPAPVEIGETGWQLPDTPTWATISVTATTIWVGTRCTPVGAEKLTKLRIWGRPGFLYNVYLVKDPTGTPQLNLLTASFKPPFEGWHTASVPTEIFGPGEAFDAVMTISVDPDSLSPTEFDSTWDYIKQTNQSAPAAGQIIHATKALDVLSIHKTDNAAADQSTDLAGVADGSTIRIGSTIWTVLGVIDQTSYIDFIVTPAAQSTASGSNTVEFSTPASASLSYVRIATYWNGDPEFEGVGSTTGYDNLTTTTNAYGIDMELTPVAFSDDWDLLAYSSASGGGNSLVTTYPVALGVQYLAGETGGVVYAFPEGSLDEVTIDFQFVRAIDSTARRLYVTLVNSDDEEGNEWVSVSTDWSSDGVAGTVKIRGLSAGQSCAIDSYTNSGATGTPGNQQSRSQIVDHANLVDGSVLLDTNIVAVGLIWESGVEFAAGRMRATGTKWT